MTASADLGPFEVRLTMLDAPIRRWRDARERAFGAAFGSTERRLSGLMSRLPRAATAAAAVGGPRDEVFALLADICDDYLRSDAERCALIRTLVHRHQAAHLLDDYLASALRMLAMSKRAEWLDRALAAASLEDQRRDYRDWLVSVGDVYIAARAAGLDPSPALKRIGALSNLESHAGAPFPTSVALGRFEDSAHFTTSVLPRLR